MGTLGSIALAIAAKVLPAIIMRMFGLDAKPVDPAQGDLARVRAATEASKKAQKETGDDPNNLDIRR